MDTSLQSDRDRGPVRYARALLISAAAIALRLVLDPLLGVWHAQLGLIVAVALSAAWCGTGPAILALVVTAVASWGLFVLPHADLANAPTPPIVAAFVSVASGGMLIWLIGALERFRLGAQRQAATAIEAEARLRQRDTTLREFGDHPSAVVSVKDLERKEGMLRSLIEIQEQEKHHLCGEFHDGLIQYAVGAKMLLESLPEGHLSPTDAAAVQAAIDSLARGIEDGRRVIRGIRPTEIDDLGLDAAILMLVNDLQVAGIEVEARIDPAACGVPLSFAATIYRIVQEALSNVRRHSHSPRVILDVCRVGDAIEIRVEDFGVGSGAPEDLESGFGITGMKERSRLVGGDCRVEFRPGRGTLVAVRLPVPVGDDPAAVSARPPSVPAEPR